MQVKDLKCLRENLATNQYRENLNLEFSYDYQNIFKFHDLLEELQYFTNLKSIYVNTINLTQNI